MLYGLVFAGFLSALVAASLPSLPLNRKWLLSYPIIWETLGAMLFALAYGLLAFGSTRPITLKKGGEVQFARAAAQFLAEQDVKDYVDIGRDILRNLNYLVKEAAFVENRWKRFSSFFQFTHRKKIEASGYASSILRILSDHAFCRALVDGCPWLVASTLRSLSKERICTHSAERFVQELASQALLSDKGSLARETGYAGFGHAPLLSESIFGDIFILQSYRPLNWLRLTDTVADRAFLERLGHVTEMAYETTLNSRDYWQSNHLRDFVSIYENIFRELDREKDSKEYDFRKILAATGAVEKAAELVQTHLSSMDSEDRSMLYVEVAEKSTFRPDDIIEITADLVCECLFAVANRFNGPNDPFWHLAMDLRLNIFPSVGEAPDGMDPLQQRIAIKLHAKICDNMAGYYPAITRVLFAALGPYRLHRQENRTAAVILEDLFYREVKGLRKLALSDPDKISDYLPANVSYDVASSTLTHNFFGGTSKQTNLSLIRPAQISLNKVSVAN